MNIIAKIKNQWRQGFAEQFRDSESEMNTQPIRKLPGAKKEFPFVKFKIDNRRPVILAKPTANATKPTTLNPDKIHLIPANSTMADGAQQMPSKVGFRFQGFGSTSITAAIPNSQTIRPLPTHLNKKIHPRDWTFSPKPEVVSAIKKTDGTNSKPKPFKANPVPRSHYDKPYPPVSIAKKNKTELARNVNKKTLEPTTPGLVSRAWHSVIDPILHPHNDASTEKVITELPLEPEKKESANKDYPKLADETVEPMAANADLPDHPGLASRMWHSVVDPILHPHTEASTEKVPLPDKKKNLDNFMSKKHFRATPAPPSTQKPSIPVVPQKRLPVRNVKNMKHLDPAEKAELQEFELTEKAILQQEDAHKEMTPSRSLKKIRPREEEDVVRKAKSLKSLDVNLQKGITSEPEKKESATVHSHPILPAETVEEPMAENAADLPDHPGLASRMWHSVVDPILHPNKKLEPDEKSIAGNDEEKADENQSDVQDEVKVDEDPEVPEAEPSEKSDLDGKMPSVPEAAHVQKITKEIVNVAAVPDENEMAPNPEAVLDPIREAVEISPFTRTVASRMETEAAGTQKTRRRHDKRRRHSESHLPRPKHSEVKPEKPEEPVRPGLLKRAVAGLGSTAWSVGKSVLTGVGSVVGLTGRNKTPIGIPEEPASKTDKKHNRHHKKKSHHQRPAGKDLEVTAVPKL
ncbi:hypothetical protein DAPPUDRAFT_329576 [Daphnia pulex]|uniref:Uncharacterized protein n=1 Tax=Daphnia pulex TaxID=6669 RepID=E9HH14_DAPPU|nr:hypothetical protein DAPPUDRAFT_329576 [Daphnia pulex]|eukprot:EFX68980.1 hypothetical protein DAPPUDRAFT_329576 [Daphnia pulex]